MNALDTPYMLFYQQRKEGKYELNILSNHLNSIIGMDNANYMKEIENNNKKVDINKIIKALAEERQKKLKEFGPEHKDDFEDDGAPGIV